MNHTGEFDPPHLTGIRSWKSVEEANRVGNLVLRESFAAPVHNLMARHDRTFHRNHTGADGFTEESVVNPDDRNLLYRRMRLDSSLYFPGIHKIGRAHV